MKAIARACLFALPLLAAASPARAQWCPPTKVDAGIGFHFNCYSGGVHAVAAPWYSYFPYNAYFQTPAPVCGWPFWPTGGAANASPGGAAPGGSRGPQNFLGMGYGPRDLQPVAYYGQPPSYWYGR
jgi:hypothetical protein